MIESSTRMRTAAPFVRFPRCGMRLRRTLKIFFPASGCWRARSYSGRWSAFQAGGRFCSTDGDFERSCPPGGGFDGGGLVRSALVMKENTRVSFFPCVYHEVDGVAKIGREFEAFASRHEIPFFTVHAGRRDLVTTAGPVTRVQRPRSP